MTRLLVRGHALLRDGGRRYRDDDGRGVCTCGWRSDPGLTNHSVAEAHRDHKTDLLEEARR